MISAPASVSSTKPLWRSTFGWFVACAASVTVAVASLPVAGWAGDVAAPVAAATVTPLVAPAAGARCRTCGVVEVVRTLQATDGAPAAYELTVRFRDGSRRLSSHSDDAGWHVGDSIMLIGGTRLADRT